MKQKLFMDIKLYDENMHTIYTQNHQIAEKAIREADTIMKKKIRGL